MARAASDSADDIKVTLFPLDSYLEAPSVPDILASLDTALNEKATAKGHHIYCELPWAATEEGILIEDWLASQKLFSGPDPKWNLGFVCLCPNDADRLPEAYRLGMEEFSRASHSSVIILKVEGEEGPPDWLGGDRLDFGRNAEIFEEVLWPKAHFDPEAPRPHSFDALDFEFLTLPYSGESATCLELFRSLERGSFGDIWGAEIFFKNSQGQFEALSLSQGRVFDWVSNHSSLVRETVANGALLNIAGVGLKKKELLENLRSQLFC